MSPAKRYVKKHAKARQRRYLKAQERLARDRRQAQHAAQALEQALEDLGLPAELVAEIEGRLRSQHKLLGKIVGVMCPLLFGCRTKKHLLATGACQVHSEDAYYGHLVLRLMGCFVLFYTSRVVCKGRLTMEEILFSLKHYWRFVDSEALELTALSQGMDEKAA
jgi:hypothetical protein